MKKFNLLLFPILFVVGSCTSVNHVSKTDVRYNTVKADIAHEDQKVNEIIAPYKIQLDVVMNEVLAVLPMELSKQKPESTLGNLVSDAIMDRLKKEGYDADFALVNYGGLRVPYLSAGNLTRGEVYELSPFDNTILIIDVPGHKLDSVFMLIAESEGWPLSKEARVTLKDKKIIAVQIDGQLIDPNKIYKLATLDYVATGGDNMKMLIPLSRKETNLVFRDVLIDYFKDATAGGKQINPVLDGRIIKQ